MSGQQDQSPPFSLISFTEFDGLNTVASRPGIKDTELSWCDGFMPVGPSNLRAIPGVGSAVFNHPTGTTINFFDFANFAFTPTMVVFPSDGSIWIVNITNNAFNEVATAGTITNPVVNQNGITQWGSEFIIVAANQTNGYFIIDSLANLYKAGGVAPFDGSSDFNSNGSGYTSTPSYSVYGGSGSGIALTTTISGGSITSVQITNPGSGYAAGDNVQVAFSGGGSDTAAVITPNISNGSIASLNIIHGGTNYTSAPTLSFLGEGAGATATATISGGAISSTSVSAGGSGYNSQSAVVVAGGYNKAASLILELMPFGVQGTAVETYQGRVFVTDGPIVFFTAPQSYTDFSTANGGGVFASFDSFLRVVYVQPLQTNGFLYLIGDSSINYIAGITTSGSPVTTSFTNQNADPETGTPFPGTIFTLGSNIVFANAYGAHVAYGGRVQKISTPLDGIYNTVAGLGGSQISGAKHILYGKRVWMVLIPVIDPISGSQVNKLFMWDEKKWWSTQQNITLTFVNSIEIESVLDAYGTDGTGIYPLFQTPAAFTKTAQSRLWAKPGGQMVAKTSNRVWLTAKYYSNSTPNITFAVDNETASSAVTLTPSGSGLTTGFYVSPATANSQTGNLLGITLTTNALDVAIVSADIDVVEAGYRG